MLTWYHGRNRHQQSACRSNVKGKQLCGAELTVCRHRILREACTYVMFLCQWHVGDAVSEENIGFLG